MKFKILFCVVTIFSFLSSAWLFILNDGAAIQYMQIFNEFGVTVPVITKSLFTSLQYWWVISAAIVFINYFFLFSLKGKWQYFSIFLSLLCFLILVGIVYAPIYDMGSVV